MKNSMLREIERIGRMHIGSHHGGKFKCALPRGRYDRLDHSLPERKRKLDRAPQSKRVRVVEIGLCAAEGVQALGDADVFADQGDFVGGEHSLISYEKRADHNREHESINCHQCNANPVDHLLPLPRLSLKRLDAVGHKDNLSTYHCQEDYNSSYDADNNWHSLRSFRLGLKRLAPSYIEATAGQKDEKEQLEDGIDQENNERPFVDLVERIERHSLCSVCFLLKRLWRDAGGEVGAETQLCLDIALMFSRIRKVLRSAVRHFLAHLNPAPHALVDYLPHPVDLVGGVGAAGMGGEGGVADRGAWADRVRGRRHHSRDLPPSRPHARRQSRRYQDRSAYGSVLPAMGRNGIDRGVGFSRPAGRFVCRSRGREYPLVQLLLGERASLKVVACSL